MSDLTTKLSLIVLLALGCFAAGWFAHAPAPPSVVTKIVQAQAAAAETVYRDDVRLVPKWRTKYVTLRDSLLQPAPDTVHDTTLVPRFIHVADSTIASCTLALTSCNRALDAQKVVVHVQQAQQPSKMRRFLTIVLAAGAGYGVSQLTSH